LDDRGRYGTALSNAAGILLALQRPEDALAPAREALAIAVDAGNLFGECSALRYLGRSLHLTGNVADAGVLLSKSLERARELSASVYEMWALIDLSEFTTHTGDPTSGADHAREALLIAEELADNRARASSHLQLGVALAQLHDKRYGWHLDLARQLAHECGDDHLAKSARAAIVEMSRIS
jgi:ATP/maltotriose-dependent transcriptional regulator MalT